MSLARIQASRQKGLPAARKPVVPDCADVPCAVVVLRIRAQSGIWRLQLAAMLPTHHRVVSMFANAQGLNLLDPGK